MRGDKRMTNFCHNCFASPFSGKCDRCGYIALEDGGSHVMLQPGIILHNRYLLGRVLGAGGFGVTYLAKDQRTNQRVAVKEYMPATFSVRLQDGKTIVPSSESKRELFDHGVDVFAKEVRTLKTFTGNPNIVQVIESFEENGTAYFAMEYLDGVTLAGLARLSGGILQMEHAVNVVMMTGNALRTVHENGMLHRDVSPDNILITREGEVKLIDFGATRYYVGEQSRSLSVVLKAGYAPPEQYSSKGNQGPWTDIYALCATFYTLILGKRPPDAPDRLADYPIENLRQYGVSNAVANVIEHGLEIDYRKRLQSIETLLQVIEAGMGMFYGQPQAQPQSQPQQVRSQQVPPQVQPRQLEVTLREEEVQERMAMPKGVGMGTPYVQVVQQGGVGDRWILPKNIPLMIGRSIEKCNVVLENRNISRIHCELHYDEKATIFYLIDHSSNGTFINGMRIETEKIYKLTPGQQFCILPNECLLEVGLC